MIDRVLVRLLVRYRLVAACFAAGLCVLPLSADADILAGMAFEGGVLRLDDETGASLPAGIPNYTAGLFLPAGITVGPDGNIYVSSRGTGEILFFDGQTGTPLPSPQSGGRDGLFATMPMNEPPEPGGDPPPPTPGPLKFGPDGNLYVSDFGNTTVRKFDGVTGQTLADAATGLSAPGGLTFGPDGALYVGNFNTSDIVRIEDGTPTPFVSQFSGGLLTPSSLLFLGTGELLAVDVYGNQILKYSSEGQFQSQFAVIPPEIPDPLPEGVNFPTNSPSDIAFDADGNLLVAVLGLTYPPDNRGALLRYDLSGGLLETIVDMQSQLGSVSWIASPDHIPGDYDDDGTVGPEDYAKWKEDYGKRVANGGGADGNGDGWVNAADYTVWRNEMDGSSLGFGADVPEPSSLLLLLAVVPVYTRCRVRRC